VPWYSGEGGLSGLVDTGTSHQGRRAERASRLATGITPRPHTWPDRGAVVPAPASDPRLGATRNRCARSCYLIQRGLLLPFTDGDGSPEGRGPRMGARARAAGYLRGQSLEPRRHLADPSRAHRPCPRKDPCVAAAADYWFKRPLLGNIVSLFSQHLFLSRAPAGPKRSCTARARLLKSGWNLVLFPEGSRSPDGRIQEFQARCRASRQRGPARRWCRCTSAALFK